MKVLFLNYEYPPLGGGAGNATQYLLREYASLPDIEVHLVTSSMDNTEYVQSVGERVFVHRIPIGKKSVNLHFQSGIDLVRYTWSGYWYARKLVAQGGFDLIHAFFSVPCGAQAFLLGKRFHIPYIVSLRGADVPGYSERFSALYAFITPFIRWIWHQAAFVVSNSSGLRQLAQKADTQQDIRVIPNGVAVDEFLPANVSESVSDVLTLLCVSRLTPRKGIRYLIQAMKLLEERGLIDRIKLRIVGDGHERAALEELASGLNLAHAIEFLGLIPHDRVSEQFQLASVFVLPSLNEGMSNTMLEALATGLPIIATVTGGTEELVEDGVNGFFIDMHSAKDIADKVERFVADRGLVRRFGTESRKRAEALSWRYVAESYIELYQQSLAGADHRNNQ